MFDQARRQFSRLGALALAAAAFLNVNPAAGAGTDLDLKFLVDPTAPLDRGAAQPASQASLFNLLTTYRVNSILIRPNMKVAVINSRQVREGDVIGNAEVVRIDKDTVTLNVAGEERVLELYGRSVKTLNTGEN